MTAGQKRLAFIFLGIAISVFLIWQLFRNINFSELYTVLKTANYWWLLPNIFLVGFSMYQRAWRWQVMIKPVKQVKYRNLLAATCIGFMANNVLPLRLGEFVRAYSLAYQDRGITKSASLANIFVERMVFDLVALLLIFGAVIASSSLPVGEDIRIGVGIAIGIALVAVVLMLVLALKPAQSGNMIVKYLFFLPEPIKDTVRGVVLKFARGLEFLTHPGAAISVALHTILLWLTLGLSNYFVFLAFGFDVPPEASYVLLVVVSISILVPSSPGFVGVFHAGAVWTLGRYGYTGEDALSFALVLHATQFIIITLMGFFHLKREHLSLRDLEKEAVETDLDNNNSA